MAETVERRSLKDWSGWDYVPGIAFLVIGVLALAEPPLASLAASVYLGAMLCVAGAFMLAGGIASIGHRGGWLSILLGILTVLVGVLIIYNPVVGAISLTWLMGAWFLVGGIFELALAFSIPAGRGWLILVGIVNIVLGAWVVMLKSSAGLRLPRLLRRDQPHLPGPVVAVFHVRRSSGAALHCTGPDIGYSGAGRRLTRSRALAMCPPVRASCDSLVPDKS